YEALRKAPTSSTRVMCSFLSLALIWASRRKRVRMSEVADPSSEQRNLSATARPRSTCLAPTTTPIPPRPMTASSAYLPSITVPTTSWEMSSLSVGASAPALDGVPPDGGPPDSGPSDGGSPDGVLCEGSSSAASGFARATELCSALLSLLGAVRSSELVLA